jgi:hypothetical protein
VKIWDKGLKKGRTGGFTFVWLKQEECNFREIIKMTKGRYNHMET